ncbi:hypothetical protein DB31_1481 [Hyalangium minutum]|uniref:Uncharacterized protein n=1 Tax=Hyalangium minutum TaxID=394096 RepID=A0A085WCF2_9BACT|nr:hypothetical protein DB31_1481 [Hyalangium minutum]
MGHGGPRKGRPREQAPGEAPSPACGLGQHPGNRKRHWA